MGIRVIWKKAICRHQVDTSRHFVGGLSNGAKGCEVAGCVYTRVFLDRGQNDVEIK